ncbi:hypothetical protein ACQ4PT_063249 [Festuca glaucescens]
MKAPTRRALLLLLLVASSVPAGLCDTNPQDGHFGAKVPDEPVDQNYPSSWTSSGDPCDRSWDGIMCSNGRITTLGVASVNLQGTMSNNIGQLSQLVFLDLSYNTGLTGPLPASIGNLVQLTTLIVAGCSFNGGIPKELGNLLKMSFLALNSNQFTGTIPASLGLLSNLYWLDLADNHLTGSLPISTGPTPGLDMLIRTQHFHFSKNQLSGPLTGLFNSNMSLLHILFDANQFSGPIPSEVGTISSLTVMLLNNPACFDESLSGGPFCSVQQPNVIPYRTSMDKCAMTTRCPSDQNQNPVNCGCAFAYSGKMIFRAALFKDSSDSVMFQQLETSLWTQSNLRAGAVELSDVHFNSDSYLQVQVELFPSSRTSFNHSELIVIGFLLSNHTYKQPEKFGPYIFIADKYIPFLVAGGNKSKFSTSAIAGIAAAAGGLLVIALILTGLFAFRQKRRNQKLKVQTKPFARWGTMPKESGKAPQLKGVRFFTFEELKSCTENFSDSYEIGVQGNTGRRNAGSMQGVVEFKNEIELLSRVHHSNLVSLIGFCFEQGEQMLVYEFVAGGTLRENLVGKYYILMNFESQTTPILSTGIAITCS